MKNKIFNIISFTCNILTIALVVFSVACFFVKKGDGNMQVDGAVCFKYFTINSNILGALCSAIIIPFNILIMCRRTEKIAKWALLTKLIGTTAVSVTFLTVICFLGPVQGYDMMFTGNSLFMHLICPLLCIISFIFFESSDKNLNWKHSFHGVVPTFVYGIVYLIMVVCIGEVNGGWVDFYGFNSNGMWYISIFAMLFASYGIAYLLYKLNKITTKKTN